MQSTFLNAHRALQRGVTPEAELAWLFKIAHNVCLTRRRSTRRRGRVESASDLQAMQDVIPAPSRENADELIRLTDALAHMPDNQRRAILLREWQGLSYHEIADELGLSQSAVETLIFRARRSLAANLEVEPERPSVLARAKAAFDIGSLLVAVKTLLGGSAAVKAAAAAVAVSGAAVVATTPPPEPAQHSPTAQLAPVVVAPERAAPVAAVEPRGSFTSVRIKAQAGESAKKMPAPFAAESATPGSSEPSEEPAASEPVAVASASAAPSDQSHGADKPKKDKADPPAQIAPVEQPKSEKNSPKVGGPKAAKPGKPGKADKPVDPAPPVAVMPAPEAQPAPAEQGSGKQDKNKDNGGGNGHRP